MDFKDKVIIVTGGGTGIGRGTCVELAKTGIKQVIGNRNEEKGNEVVEIIPVDPELKRHFKESLGG